MSYVVSISSRPRSPRRVGLADCGLLLRPDPGRHGRRRPSGPQQSRAARRGLVGSRRAEPRGRAIRAPVCLAPRIARSSRCSSGPGLRGRARPRAACGLANDPSASVLPPGTVERQHQLPPHTLARGCSVTTPSSSGTVAASFPGWTSASMRSLSAASLSDRCLGTRPTIRRRRRPRRLTSPEPRPPAAAPAARAASPRRAAPRLDRQAPGSGRRRRCQLGDTARISTRASRAPPAQGVFRSRDVDLHGLGQRSRALCPQRRPRYGPRRPPHRG